MAQIGQKRGKPTSGGTSSGSDGARMIAVVGTGNKTEYEFTASEALYPTDNVEGDAVSGTTAHSTVQSRSDNYWFRGQISSFKIVSGDPNIDIWISGTKYSPSDFSSNKGGSSGESHQP